MKIFSDCLPCTLQQILDASYLATTEEVVRGQIIDEAIEVLSKHKQYCCVPALCEAMHKVVKKHTGVVDPYAEIKAKDIAEALKLEPTIREIGCLSDDSLYNALKISAVGNIMDAAIYSNLDITGCLTEEIKKPFVICDIDSFNKDIQNANTILIIVDNAGETVFDKILAEQLSKRYEVIYAVRETAIINDVTLADASKTSIAKYAKVISSGCGMPGAVYAACNKEFQEIFDSADIVISKGQGNFEALSDSKRDVYFLLKAKCHKISTALAVDMGDCVFKKNC